MSGLFSIDSPIMVFLGKVCDMMIASLLWLVCCIPGIVVFSVAISFPSVITWLLCGLACGLIGPATTALYYDMVKVIRRGRGYIFKEFVHSFKENFKVGYISAVIVFIVGAILVMDYRLTTDMAAANPKLGNILFGIYVVLIILLVLMIGFMFPILSRFTVTVKGLFKTTFFMSLRHLLTSILLVVILAAGAIGIFLTVIGVVLIPALCAFVSSFLIERVFKKYMPKPEVSDEESGVDTWYLE